MSESSQVAWHVVRLLLILILGSCAALRPGLWSLPALLIAAAVIVVSVIDYLQRGAR